MIGLTPPSLVIALAVLGAASAGPAVDAFETFAGIVSQGETVDSAEAPFSSFCGDVWRDRVRLAASFRPSGEHDVLEVTVEFGTGPSTATLTADAPSVHLVGPASGTCRPDVQVVGRVVASQATFLVTERCPLGACPSLAP